ncbi:MAG: HepT-like ribonuclease domain-containing protein [Reyranellaceae bacterium]
MPFEAEDGALRDILHHIDLVEQFTQGYDYDRFHIETMRVYAVTRCLEIISEASRRLSNDLKARHAGIAWRQIAGAGNVYRHDYEDVAARRVWETARRELPSLRMVVEQELGGRA